MKLSINWMTCVGAAMLVISAAAGFTVATLKQMRMCLVSEILSRKIAVISFQPYQVFVC